MKDNISQRITEAGKLLKLIRLCKKNIDTDFMPESSKIDLKSLAYSLSKTAEQLANEDFHEKAN